MMGRPAPSGDIVLSRVHGAMEIVAAGLEVSQMVVHRLSLSLSEDERARAGRFAFERDWRRFVVARGRLRELLGQRLDVRPESIQFAYRKHGKPVLDQPFCRSGLRFNVAHSADLAVYAFSYEHEVGVDVEAVRALPDADDIAARFFSQREKEAYRALDSHHRQRGFFNCWTRKEAYIKALGDGLYHPLDGFDVTLAPGEPARILRVADTPGEQCGWRLESFVPAPGFIGAAAVEEASAPFAAATALSSAPALL